MLSCTSKNSALLIIRHSLPNDQIVSNFQQRFHPNAHADEILNINLQKFSKVQAILLCRIIGRNTVLHIWN